MKKNTMMTQHWTRVSDQSGVVAGSVEKHPLAV